MKIYTDLEDHNEFSTFLSMTSDLPLIEGVIKKFWNFEAAFFVDRC